MDIINLIFIAVLVILISVFLTSKHRGKKRPPGPRGLPLLGYLPFLSDKPYVKMDELGKEYGPVYSLQLGSLNVVVLSNFEVIKEAFSQDALMGRPATLPFDLSKETLESAAFTGMPWKEQRRFAIHMLRDLGFGKSRMEDYIKEEIEELLQRLKYYTGKPTILSPIIAPSMSNNITSLLFGKRLKYDDPKRIFLDQQIRDVGMYAGQMSWQVYFPWVKFFLKIFHIGNQEKLTTAIKNVLNYIKEEIKDHETTLDANNIRDFLDGYLLEIKKDKNPTFNKIVLGDLSRAFFGAGSETVRVSVEWMLLVCASFPEVQKKIQDEIDNVIGDRFPIRADSTKMPYTEAVILEVTRWATIVPINIARSALKDTEVNGFFIPKDTIIIANLWSVQHDKKVWGEDENNFRPERFLSEDGKVVKKPEQYIPFSIGKRACPGKVLAEVEVFLYFTSILQKFKLSLPPGKVADFQGILGITLQPKKQEICIKHR